jgi:acetone carboxylase gamma subunit
MSRIEDIKDASCIHDGRYRVLCENFNLTISPDNKWYGIEYRKKFCVECGEMVLEEQLKPGIDANYHVINYMDPVYRAYYTREGRKELLLELLDKLELQIPELWKNDGG